MLTDVGVVREHNEDSAHVDSKNQFFIVADGMGGHAAGEVASAMTVERVQQALEKRRSLIEEYDHEPTEEGRRKLVALLENAVRNAHKAVYERGQQENDKRGMGTTLDVVLVAGPEAFVAHVGDSRTYLIRDSRAAQITTDHTVAEVLFIEGKLSQEEAQISPLSNILVNAIGVAPDVGIEMAHIQLREGDRLLLCSDGLHEYFSMEQELADCLTRRDPEDAVYELVTQAKDRGGHDNITGIVVRVERCESTALAGDFKTPDQILAEDITATLPLDSVITDVGNGLGQLEYDDEYDEYDEYSDDEGDDGDEPTNRAVRSLARAETENDTEESAETESPGVGFDPDPTLEHTRASANSDSADPDGEPDA
jgi:serine/threonine protein phosphatase PrpC